MENQNQNQINTTQARLDEMKQLKADNQKILDDINAKGAALTKQTADLNQQKIADIKEINDKRALLARESANHENLDTVAMQKQINDLTATNQKLTAENAELNNSVSGLTQEIIDLKK